MLTQTTSTFIAAAGVALTLLAFRPQALGQKRARDLGIAPGILNTGKYNAITDVAGVRVGHVTVWEGDSVRTGVTAIVPHGGGLFQEKVPAAIFVGNGFGKLAGYTQVDELGNIEGPILLTNTLSVAEAVAGGVEYTISYPGNEQVRSVNIVVGETNDGYLNDIRYLLHPARAPKRGHVTAVPGSQGGHGRSRLQLALHGQDGHRLRRTYR